MPGIRHDNTHGTTIVQSVNAIVSSEHLEALIRYIEEGTRDDIIDCWTRSNSINDAATTVLIIKALSAVLLRIEGESSWVSRGVLLIRRILREHTKSIFKNISSARPTYVNPTLRLLISMASFDAGCLASEIYAALDFQTFKGFAKLLVKGAPKVDSSKVVLGKRKREEVDAGGPSRGLFVTFLLTLIRYAQPSVRAEILGHQLIARDLFRFLSNDSDEEVSILLRALEKIVEERDTSRSSKVQFFSENALLNIIKLYSRSEEIRHATHSFLIKTTTIVNQGVCFISHGLHPPSSKKLYNPILAEFLKSLQPLEDDLQRELLIAILRTSPELIASYFQHFPDITPHLDVRWIKAMTLLDEILSMPIPEVQSTEPAVSQHVLLENIIPFVLSRILLKGLQDESDLVKLMMTKILLTSARQLSTSKAILLSTTYEDVLETYRSRCPELQILVSLAIVKYANEEESNLLRETSIVILARYTDLFDDYPSFDFITLFNLIMLEEANERERAAVLNMCLTIPGLAWLNSKKGSDSIFKVIMQFISVTDDEELRQKAIEVLGKFTSKESFMFMQWPVPRLEAVIRAIPAKHYALITEYLEQCFIRFQATPYRYFDACSEMLGQSMVDLQGVVTASPVLTTLKEQLAFAEPDNHTVLCAWFSRAIANLRDLGENDRFCELLAPASQSYLTYDSTSLYDAIVLIERSLTDESALAPLSTILSVVDTDQETVLKQHFVKRHHEDSNITNVLPFIEGTFTQDDLEVPFLRDLLWRAYLSLPLIESREHCLLPQDLLVEWLNKNHNLVLSQVAKILQYCTKEQALTLDSCSRLFSNEKDLEGPVMSIYAKALALRCFRRTHAIEIKAALPVCLEASNLLFDLISNQHFQERNETHLDYCLQYCYGQSIRIVGRLLELLHRISDKHRDQAYKLLLAKSQEVYELVEERNEAGSICAICLMTDSDFANGITLHVSQATLDFDVYVQKLINCCQVQVPEFDWSARVLGLVPLLTRAFAEHRFEENKELSTDTLAFVNLFHHGRSFKRVFQKLPTALLEPMMLAAVQTQSKHQEVLEFLQTIVEFAEASRYNVKRVFQDVYQQTSLSSESSIKLTYDLMKKLGNVEVSMMDTILRHWTLTSSPIDQALARCIHYLEEKLLVSAASRYTTWRFVELKTEIDKTGNAPALIFCSEIASNTIYGRGDIQYNLSTIVPIIASFLVHDESIDCLRNLVAHNGLALVIMALSHHESAVRTCASKTLQTINALIEQSTIKERSQLLVLFSLLRNSMTLVEIQGSEIPRTHAVFLSMALDVLMKPSHFLFHKVNQFLLARETMDWLDIPMFYTLYASHEHYNQHLSFLLDMLRAGLHGSSYDSADWQLIRRRHVLELLSHAIDVPQHRDKLTAMMQEVIASEGGRSHLQELGLLTWIDV